MITAELEQIAAEVLVKVRAAQARAEQWDRYSPAAKRADQFAAILAGLQRAQQLSPQQEVLRQALIAAFCAGFEHSGEGYNGEWPRLTPEKVGRTAADYAEAALMPVSTGCV